MANKDEKFMSSSTEKPWTNAFEKFITSDHPIPMLLAPVNAEIVEYVWNAAIESVAERPPVAPLGEDDMVIPCRLPTATSYDIAYAVIQQMQPKLEAIEKHSLALGVSGALDELHANILPLRQKMR